MPLPKGINRPEVRGPWVAARRAKLDQFDRLVGKGMCESRAARTLKLGASTLRSYRRSVEAMDGGRQYGRGGGSNIDLGLALLSCFRQPGEPLTAEDIAAWCDCAPKAIQDIEKRAIRKLRQRFAAELADEEMVEQFNALLVAAGQV